MVCVQKSPKSNTNSSTNSSSLRQKRTTIRKETNSKMEKVERQMLMDISINKEFSGLRAVVPSASSSDLDTVLAAIDYIQHLQSQLKQTSMSRQQQH